MILISKEAGGFLPIFGIIQKGHESMFSMCLALTTLFIC
jgi:hypothetical protein